MKKVVGNGYGADAACSLVVPVYGNEASVPRLLAALNGIAARLGGGLEVVFVVDGSPDDSYGALLTRLPVCAFRSRLILLSRNFGSFAAIRVGMQAGMGEHFAVMAADLQEPPELIVGFFEELRRGDCDVVVGQRTRRADPWSTRVASRLFWGLYRKLVSREVPSGGVDVFACTRAVRDQLLSLGESNSSLVGLLFWVGFRRKLLPYERLPRLEGVSAWSLRRKLRYLSDSILTFSSIPLSLLTLLGLIGLLASTATAVGVAAGAIGLSETGRILLVVAIFATLNLLGLGVIGAYVWRILENTKARPQAITMREQSFAGAGSSA